MNYATIKKFDIANGPGVRVSLVVSGCRHHCKNCFNKEAWDFNYGKYFSCEIIDEIYKAMKSYYINGLTILGGDPMEPENRHSVLRLSKIIKGLYPNKTIWIYTGYLYEDLKDLEIMKYIDVLVDGPFIEELKDISLQFKGSSNQRIIDIPETRKSGEIKLWRN